MAHFQILPSTDNRGPHSKEKLFIKIRNGHKWLADMGAERVLLYKRRYAGQRCPNFDQIRKTNQQHGQDLLCFGTGYVGGYFQPVEIFASLVEGAPQQVTIEEFGRKSQFTLRSWTLWEPLLTNGDVIVRRNGQRFWITDVTQHRWKHFITHQRFSITEVEKNHLIYSLPL